MNDETIEASDVSVTPRYDGSFELATIVNGYLLRKQYYGYGMREAMDDFLYLANNQT